MTSRWPSSSAAYERAVKSIPGGVNSPARSFGAVGGHPLVIDRGSGPYLYDIDGNRYIDYIGSWGPLVWGHADPDVLTAVSSASAKGLSFGAPTIAETEMAELIIDAVPSIEMVRMVSSGTEASMSAIRLARGFTGRDVVVKFAGCYHGHVDSLLVQAGSSALTLNAPSSPGVTAGTARDTVVLPFNDTRAVEQLFELRGEEIAALLLEPVVGNMGLVRPLPGYLERLRQLTNEHGTILIFDEVMTGFRLSYGGAQELLGVTPDVTILGKIVGGGMPVGAFGGRRDIMNAILPVGKVFQAGTLSGNPVAMASGLATLRKLRDQRPYDDLDRKAARLAEGLSDAASRTRLSHCVARCGSMLTLFFQEGPVHDLQSALRSDTALFSKFFWEMMKRGVYWPCSQFEALFVSAAHSDDDIEATINAAHESLEQIAK